MTLLADKDASRVSRGSSKHFARAPFLNKHTTHTLRKERQGKFRPIEAGIQFRKITRSAQNNRTTLRNTWVVKGVWRGRVKAHSASNRRSAPGRLPHTHGVGQPSACLLRFTGLGTNSNQEGHYAVRRYGYLFHEHNPKYNCNTARHRHVDHREHQWGGHEHPILGAKKNFYGEAYDHKRTQWIASVSRSANGSRGGGGELCTKIGKHRHGRRRLLRLRVVGTSTHSCLLGVPCNWHISFAPGTRREAADSSTKPSHGSTPSKSQSSAGILLALAGTCATEEHVTRFLDVVVSHTHHSLRKRHTERTRTRLCSHAGGAGRASGIHFEASRRGSPPVKEMRRVDRAKVARWMPTVHTGWRWSWRSRSTTRPSTARAQHTREYSPQLWRTQTPLKLSASQFLSDCGIAVLQISIQFFLATLAVAYDTRTQ